MQINSQRLFSKALKFNFFLASLVAAIGSGVGYLLYGSTGVNSALIGAAISVVFGAMTIGSIKLGARMGLNGFYALVLGGWLLKVLLFAVLLGVLQSVTFISGPMFFFAVVASVLGALAIDSYLVLGAKLPVVEN